MHIYDWNTLSLNMIKWSARILMVRWFYLTRQLYMHINSCRLHKCAFTLEITHFFKSSRSYSHIRYDIDVCIHIRIQICIMRVILFCHIFAICLAVFRSYSSVFTMFSPPSRYLSVLFAILHLFICRISYFCVACEAEKLKFEWNKCWWKEQYCLRNRIENVLDTIVYATHVNVYVIRERVCV